LPVPENTAEVGTFVPVIDDINISLKFIEHVKNASLEEYLDKEPQRPSTNSETLLNMSLP
jgi:hypothetical protein